MGDGVRPKQSVHLSIMTDLKEKGVFKLDYAVSADLADIHIVKLSTDKARTYHD